MRLLLLLFFTYFSQAQAGFEKLSVKNLNLSYSAPYGEGTLDKVGLGYSLKDVQVPYAISLEKKENAFEVTSSFLDFTWMKPYRFFYHLEKLKTVKTDFSLGGSQHALESSELRLVPEGRGEYIARKVKASCLGTAQGEFKVRVLEDCRTRLDATIERVEVPSDFFLYRILYDLPRTTGVDIPADNFVLKANDGNFHLQLYIKYYVYAGLRATGHFQYEDDYQTLAIKVNQIKFGYLTVTNFVMNRLREIITSPDVKVDPPWIRINIGTPNELK